MKLSILPKLHGKLLFWAATDWQKQRLISRFNLQQLLNLPLIADDKNLPLVRRYFAEVFKMKLDTQAVVTVADLRIVRLLVSLSQGYTVLPKYLGEQQLQISILSLLHQTELYPNNSLHLVWNKTSLRHPIVVYTRDRLLEIL